MTWAPRRGRCLLVQEPQGLASGGGGRGRGGRGRGRGGAGGAGAGGGGALTCTGRRATGSPGIRGRAAAGSPRRTRTRYSDSGRARCTRGRRRSGSPWWTSRTGTRSPRSRPGSGICRSRRCPALQGVVGLSPSLPSLRPRPRSARPPVCPRRPRRPARALTLAPADPPVVALAVDIVALAVASEDLLVGHVALVAHALSAQAVPQPRADDGVVVAPAAALQLLAAPAVRLAFTALPDVASLTPAAGAAGLRSRGGRRALGPLSAEAGLTPPHLQTPHSRKPLPPQSRRSRLMSRQWHSHWGTTCTVTVSVKPRARMRKDCSGTHSEAVTFTWKVICAERAGLRPVWDGRTRPAPVCSPCGLDSGFVQEPGWSRGRTQPFPDPRKGCREAWGGDGGKNTEHPTLIQDLASNTRRERRASGAAELDPQERGGGSSTGLPSPSCPHTCHLLARPYTGEGWVSLEHF